MCNFKSSNFIAPTPMIKWYLKEGANISSVDWAISYVKGAPLKEFIDKQTRARIQADLAGKSSLSLLHKTISNSVYGRLR